MKKLLAILSLGLLAGCATQNKYAPSMTNMIYTDYSYYAIEKSVIKDAVRVANQKMIEDGWEYVPEKEDCDDFAFKKRTEIIHYLRDVSQGIGSPMVAYFSYIKTNGDKHSLIKVLLISGETVYFEPQNMENDLFFRLPYSEIVRVCLELR